MNFVNQMATVGLFPVLLPYFSNTTNKYHSAYMVLHRIHERITPIGTLKSIRIGEIYYTIIRRSTIFLGVSKILHQPLCADLYG